MAFAACETGGSLPAVLNAANEVAVHGFLKQEIGFLDIARVIRRTMEKHTVAADPNLAEIMAADSWARECAHDIIDELRK